MPGPTRHLGAEPNSFEWSIAKDHAYAFEVFVLRYLKRTVATRDGRTKVLATPRVGDKGRDVEIQHLDPIHLFGTRVSPPPDGSVGTIYVECKATAADRLDDAFLVDASQHADRQSSLYVLVTNAWITPYCHFRAETEWGRRGTKFLLVDRRRLFDSLAAAGLLEAAAKAGLLPGTRLDRPVFDPNHLIVSCQTEHERGVGRHAVRLHVVLRNYSLKSQLASIGLASDVGWAGDRSKIESVIEAGRDAAFVIRFIRQSYDARSDLNLSLTVDGRSQGLRISPASYEIVFEPPFVGAQRRQIGTAIRRSAEAATGFALLSIHGEAGVGKSRTIETALDPLRGGQFSIFRLDCDPTTGEFDVGRVEEDFSVAFSTTVPMHGVCDAIEAAIRLCAPTIFVLEDLHHAGPDLLQTIKLLITSPPKTTVPVVVITTGRDDYTFPNPGYYSFLDLACNSSAAHVETIPIPCLTDDDALTLIKAVAIDLPMIAVERIRQIGQNNPFVLIECLQYLLDTGLANLLSRQTIGVADPERFAGLEGLPVSVEDLYERRVAALSGTPEGEIVSQFLSIASFFGPIIEKDVFDAFFDGDDSTSAEAILLNRRFVQRDPTDGRQRFAHENLYHFLRRRVRSSIHAQRAAALFLERPGLMKRLPPFARGEVYCMSGYHSEALEKLAPIWSRVQLITNFSSEEIDKRYFSFLDALFETTYRLKKPRETVAKVALAIAYMGVHNFSLFQGELACARAEVMLDRLFPKPSSGLEFKLAVRQLRAHALQNMGRTNEALRLMLELEATIKEGVPAPSALEYDLYDRLQEYYRKINHPELVAHYGRLAARSVERAGDEKLRASHLITQSLAALFLNKAEALRLARVALQAAEDCGIRRFIVFNRLTELVAEALYAGDDASIHHEVHEEARAMLKAAAVDNLSDSIVRLELLLGTTALLAFPNPREAVDVARTYIAAGHESALRFGNGLFDWAFDNLSVAVDLRDPGRTDEDVRRRVRTCLDRLKRRGLTNVGACGGTYPNVLAISNAIRFYAQFSENLAMETLRSVVVAYDSRFLSDDQKALGLVRRAAEGKAILWPSTEDSLLRYPARTGYFTPVF